MWLKFKSKIYKWLRVVFPKLFTDPICTECSHVESLHRLEDGEFYCTGNYYKCNCGENIGR